MKKIIIPVDFSASAAAALRFATYLSQATQFQLSVIFVYDPMIVSNRPDTARERQEERERLQQQLESFTHKNVRAGDHLPPPEIIVAEGVPPTYIKWRSLDDEAALIIMGGIGTSAGGSLDVFGGIAREVWQEGGCPVILIPRNFTDEMMERTANVWYGVERTIASIDG